MPWKGIPWVTTECLKMVFFWLYFHGFLKDNRIFPKKQKEKFYGNLNLPEKPFGKQKPFKTVQGKL